MKSLVALCVLFLTRSENNVVGHEDIDSMQHVIDWIEENLSPSTVSIVVESMENLSPLSSNIIKKISHRSLTVIEDYNKWRQLEECLMRSDNSSGNEQSKDKVFKEGGCFRRSPIKLVRFKIGILELQDRSNPTAKLIQMFEHFLSSSYLNRGKCFMFLINRNDSDLGSFLRYVWSANFLDFTVVQWILNDQNVTIKLNQIDRLDFPEPIMHSYYPFHEEYRKSSLTRSTNIMPSKLGDLNGFPLRAEVFEDEPNVMLKRNRTSGMIDWESSTGYSVQIIKTIAKAMNFTVIPELIDRARLLNKKKSLSEIKRVDFVVNPVERLELLIFCVWIDRNYGQGSCYDVVSVPAFFDYHFIIRQRVSFKTEIPADFFMVINVFLIIALIFLCGVRLLKFHSKIWTPYNITSMLMAGSMKTQAQMKPSEMIFALSVCIVSVILFLYGSNHLMHIIIFNKQTIKLETLMDIVKSGIPLNMGNGTLEYLRYYGDAPIVEKILNQSKAIDDNLDCIAFIFSGNKKIPINVCIGDRFFGDLITDRFSDSDSGWVLTLVSEPLIISEMWMMLAHASPYVYKFQDLYGRIFESGLMEHWHQSAVRDLMSHRVPAIDNTKEELTELFQSEEEKNTPLRIRLLYFLVSGYAIASVVFIFEMIWHRFNLGKK